MIPVRHIVALLLGQALFAAVLLIDAIVTLAHQTTRFR